MEVSGHFHTMVILLPEKEPSVIIECVGEWAIELVLTLQRGKVSAALATNLTMIVGLPACSLVTIPSVSPCHAGRWLIYYLSLLHRKVFRPVHNILKSDC
jgi:hypothetical protein